MMKRRNRGLSVLLALCLVFTLTLHSTLIAHADTIPFSYASISPITVESDVMSTITLTAQHYGRHMNEHTYQFVVYDYDTNLPVEKKDGGNTLEVTMPSSTGALNVDFDVFLAPGHYYIAYYEYEDERDNPFTFLDFYVAGTANAELRYFALKGSVDGQADSYGVIDHDAGTIIIDLPHYHSNLNNATAEFAFNVLTDGILIVNGERIAGTSVTADFTSPVTVTASTEDGSVTKDYTVTVINGDGSKAVLDIELEYDSPNGIVRVDKQFDEESGVFTFYCDYNAWVISLRGTVYPSFGACVTVDGEEILCRAHYEENYYGSFMLELSAEPTTFTVTSPDGEVVRQYTAVLVKQGRLASPENVRWISPIGVAWSTVEGCEGEYELKLYWSAEEAEVPPEELWQWAELSDEMEELCSWEIEGQFDDEAFFDQHLKEYIYETGWYYISVKAIGNGDIEDSLPVFATLEYVRPEQQLATPAAPKWHIEDGNAYMQWGEVSNRPEYQIEIFCGGTSRGIMMLTYNTSLKANPYWWEQQPGSYSFRVRAVADDVANIAHSLWSELSPGFDLNLPSDMETQLQDILNQNGLSAQEILDALGALDPDILKGSIEDNEQARALLVQLETKYAQAKGITVDVSGDSGVSGKLDTAAITIEGAAFSGMQNADMKLSFKTPNSLVVVDNSQYKNWVQFSVTLEGAEDAGSLAVPVRITMPIPQGVKPSRICILHYHANGSYEEIWPTLNGDGTISFVITGFSEFVFANPVGDEDSLTINVMQPGTLQQKVEAGAAPADIVSLTVTGSINETDLDYLWLSSGTSGSTALISMLHLDLSGAVLDGSTTLPASQFAYSPFQSVALPAGITVIDESAFQGCLSLQEVTVPASLERVEKLAFTTCKALKAINFSHCIDMDFIGDWNFYQCDNLEDAKLPAKLKSLSYSTFGLCLKLRSIEMPEAFETFGQHAFYGSENLMVTITNANTIASVQAGGYPTFKDCKNVTVVVPDVIYSAYCSAADWMELMQKEAVRIQSFGGITNAQRPMILMQPVSATIAKWNTHTLSITAVVMDGGTLYYQWYKDSDLILGANGASYEIPADLDFGYHLYHVDITNTNNSVAGNKTTTLSSATAVIEVVGGIVTNAQAPVFSSHPWSGTVNQETPHILYTQAEVSDGGSVYYQWYMNGYSISGATGSSYEMPSLLPVGTYTFHVVAVNINPSATNTLAFACSNAGIVEVIPAAEPDTYIAIIDPTSKTFSAVTAGYGVQSTQQFTITNTGTGQITGLTAMLQKGAGSGFEISTNLSVTSISGGSTATISVWPKTGLTAGTHTDTLKITGSNGIALSVSLGFTVNAAPTYTVNVVSAGAGSTGDGDSYEVKSTVTVSAGMPPKGMQFKEWTITPSVIFVEGTDKTNSTAKFTMPAQAVTATASFEAITVTVTGVTVTPATVTVQKGSTRQFSATVEGTNNPGQGVTWSVSSTTGSSISSSGVLTVGADETATTLTVRATSTVDNSKFGTVTVTISSSSGGNGGNSGSGGNGGGTMPSVTPAAAPEWLEQGKTSAPIAEAKEQGRSYALTRAKGQYGVRAAAWLAFTGYQYWHDTMDGNAVQVRVYIRNPAAITSDLMVSGYVRGTEAESVKTLFEKHFVNKVCAIHLDQTGDWEQPVEIAAKVDLTGMDITKLMLYSYDKATNTYKHIEKPAYWIDKNGYLHFTTPYAGDIVISGEKLVPQKNGGAE